LFELITQRRPPKRGPATRFGFVQGELEKYLPPDCPSTLKDLVLRSCKTNPDQRPDSTEVLSIMKLLKSQISGGSVGSKGPPGSPGSGIKSAAVPPAVNVTKPASPSPVRRGSGNIPVKSEADRQIQEENERLRKELDATRRTQEQLLRLVKGTGADAGGTTLPSGGSDASGKRLSTGETKAGSGDSGLKGSKKKKKKKKKRKRSTTPAGPANPNTSSGSSTTNGGSSSPTVSSVSTGAPNNIESNNPPPSNVQSSSASEETGSGVRRKSAPNVPSKGPVEKLKLGGLNTSHERVPVSARGIKKKKETNE